MVSVAFPDLVMDFSGMQSNRSAHNHTREDFAHAQHQILRCEHFEVHKHQELAIQVDLLVLESSPLIRAKAL